ncbi:MAG: DNA (cytosine-5-)-methyltransferase [Parcubacteria group bacterium]|nr:DNA (cytosine-5-)-methyltransferase [Parcubacteria group bacterium]|tara:strand:- start:413 stop:1972 length:1560 start_codon:yes stop_codon:yes gene_type:complete
MLTKRQKQILDYITKCIKENDYAPSLEEIKKYFKLSSVSTIHQHIEALREKGYLKKIENQPRSIELNNKKEKSDLVEIPLLGIITAGSPIEAIETPETITLPKSDIPKSDKCYSLRVRGDSMIDEGIFDKDIVVIKKQSVAENGQTVVAIIDDNEATLKKIYRENGQFRLQPANQSILPLYRKQVEIRGVVYKIIRNFSDMAKSTNEKLLRTIDLFAGIGGIRLGFEKAGFRTVFSNDYESQCEATYNLNFPDSKLVIEDIRKIGIDDLPEFDFLLGGFPCQAFSIAGHRQGFKDKRGNLFFDIARILEVRKPTGFLLENVKNLQGHDKGRTFQIIKETLENLGYHIKAKVLNSMKYGNVPQNRERIYIAGFKNKKQADKFDFPKPIKLKTKITDLLESNVDKRYYYNDKPLYTKIKDHVVKKNTVYQWRRKYVRENKKSVCPTLTANMGTGGHNVPIIKDDKGIRKLTPTECARIQGLPRNYKLPNNISTSALYKQLGNSVTVPVIYRIAKKIQRAVV